ncbi:MAG: hypothetical protein AB3N14_13735 [Flavobacteriaceae bacterium]
MKKLMILLLAGALSINLASAANNTFENPTITLRQTSGAIEKKVVLEYDSFQDMQTFDSTVVKDLFETKDDDCEVTATVTVSHTFSVGGDIGVANSGHETTISISAEVTASCSEIGDAVKNLIAKLRKALGL